jgi:hypothetical protein
MQEGLGKLLGDIAQMQALPDADIDFLTQLQQVIVGKIRSSVNQGQNQQAQMAGGGGGIPAQSQMPPSPSPMGGPAMGLSATGNVGNMDELARVLGGASQAG